MRNLHLIYGARAEQVNEQRIKLVHELLDPEERTRNYTEIYPPENRRALELKTVYSDILSELGTQSLFGGHERRVVCVSQLKELLRGGGQTGPRGGKRKKKSDDADKPDLMERFCSALESTLNKSNNVAIFVVVEDNDKMILIDTKSPLFELIKRLGTVQYLKTLPLVFDFEDALLARNSAKVIDVLHRWMKGDEEVKRRVFSTLLKTIRLLLQVRIWMDLMDEDMDESEIKATYFPSSLRPNIFSEKDFRRKKLVAGGQLYTRDELEQALRDLLPLNKLLYPTQRDVFVADFQLALELYITKLCAGQFNAAPVARH